MEALENSHRDAGEASFTKVGELLASIGRSELLINFKNEGVDDGLLVAVKESSTTWLEILKLIPTIGSRDKFTIAVKKFQVRIDSLGWV